MATAPSPPILVWQPGGGVPVGPVSNPPVYSQAGITQLVAGQSYVDVVFGTTQTTADWVLVECEVVNTTDVAPLNIWPGITTSKLTTGFRLYLNGLPDSSNYYLHWAVSGVNILPVPATTYYLTGPSTGLAAAAATFTVSLPPSTTVPASLTITPSDGGVGGVFSPSTVTLTNASPSMTFTYTPESYGAITISVTNNRSLTNPAGIVFTVPVPTYSLSGPSTGVVGVASTNFTVAVSSGALAGGVTVTPSDSGGGGTFTPTTVILSPLVVSATFTYTPASSGAKTISVTNSGGLTNPASLTYTVAAAPHLLNTLISYWKMDEASGTRNDSQGTNHLTASGAPVGVAGKINNGAQFISASSQFLFITSNSSLQVASDFTFSVWFNLASVAATKIICTKSAAGTTNDYSLMYLTGTGLAFWVNIPLSGSNAAITPVLSASAWYHAVVWFDSGTGQVYLRLNDTTTYQSSTSPGLATPGSDLFIFGSGTGAGTYLDGLVDEVGFWKRKLTSVEITALYNAGAGLPFSSFTT